MNEFIKIYILAIILLLISIINETYNPYIENCISLNKYIYVYTNRYIHYSLIIFSCFYLLFFEIGTNLDYIYLLFMLHIVITWYVFDSCWLCYIELLCYDDIDLENTKITIQPIFDLLFYKYTKFILPFLGLIYIINICYVLYYLNIPTEYKIIFFITYMFFFIYPNLPSETGAKYYSTNNKCLAFIKSVFTN